MSDQNFHVLEGLDLRSINVTDLTPLANLTNLTSLYLRFRPSDVADLTPLEQMITIKSELSI